MREFRAPLTTNGGGPAGGQFDDKLKRTGTLKSEHGSLSPIFDARSLSGSESIISLVFLIFKMGIVIFSPLTSWDVERTELNNAYCTVL